MTDSRRIGLWVTLAAALAYCSWLGIHWLPLPYSDKELAASASRVWDIKNEITSHHHLPWWTPNFMSGSSYAINHSRGFYLVPWIAFSAFTDLESAGKLMALLAIFASALAMYGCARHFLRSEWAATLAAMAYMLHPEQIIRAAGAEHMTISLFFPFMPLLWWTFARMLDTGKTRDVVLCALVAVFAMWTDNKQAVISFFYLAGYLVYWLWTHRQDFARTARTLGLLAAFGLTMGAVLIVPGIVEAKYVKLFDGDPLSEWQKGYAFKSLFGLVDRNGVVTHDAVNALMAKAQTHQIGSQAQLDAARRIIGMQMDSPEKYLGLAFILLLAGTALWNRRRENGTLFWFFVAMLMLSVMLATGFGSVWNANMKTWDALSAWGMMSAGMWLAIVAAAAFLVVFAWRKLTTPRKWLLAGGVLVIFLFLPAFELLANLPYFKDIRAPYSFYDGPGAFWCAILIGFFVTDCLKSRIPWIVAGVSLLLALDYWPYQKPMKTSLPPTTIQNLESTYRALATDSDWVKTYSISGRYFHLLGPMYSGKPQIYEAFYNWQSPLGLGLLNQHGFIGTPDGRVIVNRPMLDLLGGRYVVFDLQEPGCPNPQSVLEDLRQNYALVSTNENFVVFRNDSAKPYVSATTRTCVFLGDIHQSPQLALALEAKHFTLVHDVARERLHNVEQIYEAGSLLYPPVTPSQVLPLSDVRLSRENSQLIRITFSSPQPCVAVIAESYYPFWRAEVDGKPAEVLRVNCAIMGVEVSSGVHEIMLRYEPPRIYAVAGVVTVLGFVAGLVVATRTVYVKASRGPK